MSTEIVIPPRKGITTVPALIADAGDQAARHFLIDEERLIGRLDGGDAGAAKLSATRSGISKWMVIMILVPKAALRTLRRDPPDLYTLHHSM